MLTTFISIKWDSFHRMCAAKALNYLSLGHTSPATKVKPGSHGWAFAWWSNFRTKLYCRGIGGLPNQIALLWTYPRLVLSRREPFFPFVVGEACHSIKGKSIPILIHDGRVQSVVTYFCDGDCTVICAITAVVFCPMLWVFLPSCSGCWHPYSELRHNSVKHIGICSVALLKCKYPPSKYQALGHGPWIRQTASLALQGAFGR